MLQRCLGTYPLLLVILQKLAEELSKLLGIFLADLSMIIGADKCQGSVEAKVVLVVTQGSVEGSKLAKLVPLEFILAFGDRGSLGKLR